MSSDPHKPFRFKQFEVSQGRSAMRVGTDAVLFAAWVGVESAKYILDVGTGSGVIALILAQRNQHALIDAIEIDSGSSEDSEINFKASPWHDRLRLYEGDFLKIIAKDKFDLIVSNPPYFSQSLRASDPIRNTARHDDSLPAEAFMIRAKSLLTAEGRVALIFPTTQLERWIVASAAVGLVPARVCHVFTLAHKDSSRVMVEFSAHHKGEPKMESVLIEKSPGEFSEAYKKMTSAYYTKW